MVHATLALRQELCLEPKELTNLARNNQHAKLRCAGAYCCDVFAIKTDTHVKQHIAGLHDPKNLFSLAVLFLRIFFAFSNRKRGFQLFLLKSAKKKEPLFGTYKQTKFLSPLMNLLSL